MENKKLLIVGIDPGTTTAYAVLDIEGNLIHLHSSKQLGLRHIISEAINLGKVVLVGTDKTKIPRLVEAFATKLGANTISPKEDIKVEEKRKITSNFNFADEHQGDALASALLAYREAKPLLDKIDFFVEENKKHSIKDKIKELVITKNISIKTAVGIIDKKDEETKIIEKVIVDKKLSEQDFLKLYGKLKKYESEIKLIRTHNSNLKNRIAQLEKSNRKIDNEIKKEELKDYNKKTDDFRESRIRFLENALKSKEKYAEELKLLIDKHSNIISNINNYHILKKLDTLGANEFNFKNKILNVQKNDIILVENPDIASNSVVDSLKNMVFIIVHKKPISKKNEARMPFLFIGTKNLKIEEDKYFGFVDKKQFEIEKGKVDWVRKIVDDYRREKQQLV